MPIVKKEKLRESLRKREIAPVYLLYGAETYLRDTAARTIADLTFSTVDVRDFNENEFSLNPSDSLKTALAAAEQLPMMAAKRLIRITDVRISSTGRLDTVREEHENLLSGFLERPPEHSVVIFIADELSSSRKLSKLLKEKCVSVEFQELEVKERSDWARTRINDLGSNIDDNALRHLITLTGADLRRLSNEIAKLSTAALPDKRISTELIDSLVANTGEIGQWDFLNHLNAGRKRGALAALKKMLDDGEEPLMILGQIAGSYRRNAIEGRDDRMNMAARMKRLERTDLAIKTSVGAGGPAGVRMHLEKLVCELTLI
jgi:DNA polymerase-3 subunit delta